MDGVKDEKREGKKKEVENNLENNGWNMGERHSKQLLYYSIYLCKIIVTLNYTEKF